MRTYTQQDIDKRKSDIINIPDEILIKEKTLIALEQNLQSLVDERDQRFRQYIQPQEQCIRGMEARIATFDLPPQIEQLRAYIQQEQSTLVRLKQTRDRLLADIKPLEENIQKSTIAVAMKESITIVNDLKTTLLELKTQKERHTSKLATYKSNLLELETALAKAKETNNQEAITKLTSEMREVNNQRVATDQKLSNIKSRIHSTKKSITEKDQSIARNKAELGDFFYFDLFVQANLTQARASLTPLLEQHKRVLSDIESHEENEKRYIRDQAAKTSALAKALNEQAPYHNIEKDAAQRMLAEFIGAITPHRTAQANTEKKIRETESNIQNRRSYIRNLQAKYENHINNTFLIHYEDNPSVLLSELSGRIFSLLTDYQATHKKLECQEVRRCLYEFASRVNFIAGDEAAARNENADERRLRLQRLTGYVWSLINRAYKDPAFKDLLRLAFNGVALDEHESLAAYRPYAERSPAYLRDFTDFDIRQKEEGEFTEICNTLRAALQVNQHKNAAEIKLYRTGRALFTLIEELGHDADENKAYLTHLLVSVHNLLLNYIELGNHTALSDLAKLNTSGLRSNYKMIGGGLLLLLGSLAAGFAATSEESSSLGIVLSALAVPFGAGLLFSGRTQGLQQALEAFLQAAHQARRNPELQHFGFFNPPAQQPAEVTQATAPPMPH